MKGFLVGVVVAGLCLATGMALAAPGDNGAVAACYHNNNGGLRVDTGGGCKGNETSIELGTALTTHTVVVTGELPSPGFVGLVAECAPGEVLLGGGYELASINPDMGMNGNGPTTLPSGQQAWVVNAYSAASGAPTVSFSASAICAAGTPG